MYTFFFQAEDGIRDYKVTVVQTCALPIWATCRATRTRRQADRGDAGFPYRAGRRDASRRILEQAVHHRDGARPEIRFDGRSEERRVGKEWRRRYCTES